MNPIAFLALAFVVAVQGYLYIMLVKEFACGTQRSTG